MNSKIKSLIILAIFVIIPLFYGGLISAIDNYSSNILSTTVIPFTWCHTFNTNLGYANNGTEEVAYLHTALKKEGILYGKDAVNQYGYSTMLAVTQLQKKYNITVQNGYFGDAIRSEMNKVYGCNNSFKIATSPLSSNIQAKNVSFDFLFSASLQEAVLELNKAIQNFQYKPQPAPVINQEIVLLPSPVCTFEVGIWSDCINGQQIRLISPSPTGCIEENTPASTQVCVLTTQPFISSVSPASGQWGSKVTVNGQNFTSTGNNISFTCSGINGGGSSNVSSADGKTLLFNIPNPPSLLMNYPISCKIGVVNANGISNETKFSVISLTPTLPFCSIKFSSDSIIAPGTVYLSWTSSNVDKLEGYCTGPIKKSISTHAFANNGETFTFDNPSLIPEFCKFTPSRDGVNGISCWARVNVSDAVETPKVSVTQNVNNNSTASISGAIYSWLFRLQAMLKK